MSIKQVYEVYDLAFRLGGVRHKINFQFTPSCKFQLELPNPRQVNLNMHVGKYAYIVCYPISNRAQYSGGYTSTLEKHLTFFRTLSAHTIWNHDYIKALAEEVFV